MSASVLDTKTMKLSGLYSIEVLIPSKQNLHYCSWVLISRVFYQYASHNWFWGKSLRKKQSAFTPRGRFSRRDLARTTNKRTKFLHCAKTHSQGRPCTNPTKVQAPSDQKKKSRPSSASCTHLHREDQLSFLWKKDCGSLFSLHRNTSTVWSLFERKHRIFFDTDFAFEKWMEQFLAQIDAWSASQHTILEFQQVVGCVIRCTSQT